MTDHYEPDPEVLADLQLRESSMRDRSRTRSDPAAYTPPVLVAVWPCRYHDCTMVVPVTQDAYDTLAMFNAEIRRRGWEQIDKGEVMVCARHEARFKRERAQELRSDYAVLNQAIRVIRNSKTPKEEHQAIAVCKRYQHPDLDGLLVSAESRVVKAKSDGKKPKADL